MAGLIAAAREGALPPGEPVVFWHTGGLPGLFGHRDAATLGRPPGDGGTADAGTAG
jgi:hypothetical protein